MIRKILLLLSGNAMTSLIQFARTILITRLISVEDFGIATTFMVSIAITQLLSNIGLNHMIIQAADGDDDDFQKSLQGFQFLRGVFGAVMLFALAHPMAVFLGYPELTWTYQLLAVVPLLGGMAHFDMFRLQRRMRYGPFLIANVLPPLLSLLAIWPISLIYGDYRIMLVAVLLQWGLHMVVTHLVSERRYGIAFDRAIIGRGFRFGWPLFLNAGLLFVLFQGERLVVGRELGMAVLAIFAMGVSLVQVPMSATIRALHQFLLPQLSAAKDDDAEFAKMAQVTLQASIFATGVLALGVFLVGPPVVLWTLGDRYAQVLDFLLVLAVIETVRLVRSGMSQVALARAHTETGLLGNLPRVIAIGLAWHALVLGHGLPAVLAIALAGEMCGFAVELFLVVRLARVPLRLLAPGLLALGVFLCVLLAASPMAGGASGPLLGPLAARAAVIASFAVLMAALGPFFAYVRARKMTAYS